MSRFLELTSSAFAAAFVVLSLLGCATAYHTARADEPLISLVNVDCGCTGVGAPCTPDPSCPASPFCSQFICVSFMNNVSSCTLRFCTK